jgi:hypothetical protein
MRHLGPRNAIVQKTFIPPDKRSEVSHYDDTSVHMVDPTSSEFLSSPSPPDTFHGTVTVPLPPQMDDTTADAHLPRSSQVIPSSRSLSKVLNLSSPLNHYSPTDPAREKWAIDTIPSSIQLKLNTPFGKENLNQCFMLEPSFYHLLLPLYHSGYLTPQMTNALYHTSSTARSFCNLISKFGNIDFRPLRNPIPEWSIHVKNHRTAMITAALLHYNGKVADVVRFIGGEHVSAHRDIPTTINRLRGIVDPDVLKDLERVFTLGVPGYVNASSTQANLAEYVAYGNHKSISAHPALIDKALEKECSRQYVLHADKTIWPFIQNLHCTPMGLVNPDHPYKKPRITFDATVRIKVWSMAVNDWTSIDTEPEIIFGSSLLNYFTYIWNLRISYPTEDIYPGDDDFDGAFKRNKYNPDIVSLHAFMIGAIIYFATGTTFGDATSPSNFEPVARSRQQLAQYLWSRSDTIDRIQEFLPALRFAPEPSKNEQTTFVQANTDSLNPGVLRTDGSRRPPTFDHHVDDALYADIRSSFKQTVASSILALYLILGFPKPGLRDPLSRDKFNPEYTHTRPSVGVTTNTRTMIVGITDIKRQQVVNELYKWRSAQSFDLLEIATLHGILGALSRWCRWGRVHFFAIQNEIRRILRSKYNATKAVYLRQGRDLIRLAELPNNLMKRLTPLIASDIAKLLWFSKCKYKMSEAIRYEITTMHDYLSDFSLPWELSIAHAIPRTATSESHGDASWEGSAAFSTSLFFWFTLSWSPETLRRIHLHAKHPDYVHINCLEFLTVLLQLAALITRLEDSRFAAQFPEIPMHKCHTDNMPSKSWATKVSSTSFRGQRLVGIHGLLLARTSAGFITDFIEGKKNVTADFISRPQTFFPHPAPFPQQIYQHNGLLTQLDFFLPNPEFLSHLTSMLYSNVWEAPTSLPKMLGQFVPAASITSNSLML